MIEVFELMKRYERQGKRFSEAKPNPATARTIFNEQFRKLTNALQDPEIVEGIDRVLAHSTSMDRFWVKGFMKQLDPNHREAEVAVSHLFGVRKKIARNITDPNMYDSEMAVPINSVTDMLNSLQRIHAARLAGIDRSRALARKEKKVIKTSAKKAGWWAGSGTGMIVANSVFPSTITPISYGIGISAFVKVFEVVIEDSDEH